MKVGIIGIGKLGSGLAMALNQEGFNLSGVCGRNKENVKFLKSKLNVCETSYEVIVKDSDVVFLAVQDREIRNLVELISKNAEAEILNGKVFFHLSGALTSDALDEIKQKGAIIASLHPVQTFSDVENSLDSFYNIYFGFEGMQEAMPIAEKIVESLSGKIINVPKESKPLYHLAASLLSNYLAVLTYTAEKILQNTQIDCNLAMKAFKILIDQTYANVIEKGSIKALTGPIARGDYITVNKHIDAMARNFPEFIDMYKSLGKIAIKMTEQIKPAEENIKKIYDILENGE